MVTIKDIAMRCGVSVATVSYVLNGKGHISEDMRLKIQETANNLGYVPSQAARNLQNKKSNYISVIIPEITSFFNNQIFDYLEREIRKCGKQVIVGCSAERENLEVDLFKNMLSQNPAGIIWFPSKFVTEKTFSKIDKIVENKGVPVVVVYKKMGTKNLKYLTLDIQGGIKKITGYLLDKGLKDVLFFGDFLNLRDHYAKLKYDGYVEAFIERGLEPPSFTCGMQHSYLEARKYTNTFLDGGGPLPQAIVAVNDISGYGIVRALEEREISVPQEVNVVGIDGIKYAYSKHQLTTCTAGLETFAQKCVKVVLEFDKYKEDDYVFEYEIIQGTTSI